MDFWQNKRVVVTGGSGLLGSCLINKIGGAEIIALEHDDGVYAADRIVRGDLRSIASLERLFRDRPVDIVFHLGAQPIVPFAQEYPLQTVDTNVIGTANLLEVIRRGSAIHHPLVIVASTDKVYGRTEYDYDENMSLGGYKQIYEASKCAMEYLCLAYKYSYNIPIIMIRSSNIYGPGDNNFSRIIPGAIKAGFTGETLYVRSDGKQVRDYVYISDVIRGYLRVAEKLFNTKGAFAHNVFNFGTGRGTQTLELLERIQAIMNRRINIVVQGLVHAVEEIPSQVMNYEKAANLLDWFPEFDLDGGLRVTVDWYKNIFGESHERI